MAEVGVWLQRPDGVKEHLSRADVERQFGHFATVVLPEETHAHYRQNKWPSVSTIVGWRFICSLKEWFAYNFPIHAEVRSLYALARGVIFHRSVMGGAGMRELEMLDTVTPTGAPPIVWGGTADSYEPASELLYEAKTTRALPRAPRDWHRLQTALYTYLLRKQGRGVKRVRWGYFTFEEWTRFESDPDTLTDLSVMQMVTRTHRAITAPHGSYRASWACGYCPYSRYCPVGFPYLRNTLQNARARWERDPNKRGRPPSFQPNTQPGARPQDEPLTWDELVARGQLASELPFQKPGSEPEPEWPALPWRYGQEGG